MGVSLRRGSPVLSRCDGTAFGFENTHGGSQYRNLQADTWTVAEAESAYGLWGARIGMSSSCRPLAQIIRRRRAPRASARCWSGCVRAMRSCD